jgi:hypothetical protein
MIRQLRHFTQAHRLNLAVIMGRWMILVNKGFEATIISGASQFLNSGGKFSLAPGFSPVMMVQKRRKAVSTRFSQ